MVLQCHSGTLFDTDCSISAFISLSNTLEGNGIVLNYAKKETDPGPGVLFWDT